MKTIMFILVLIFNITTDAGTITVLGGSDNSPTIYTTDVDPGLVGDNPYGTIQDSNITVYTNGQ